MTDKDREEVSKRHEYTKQSQTVVEAKLVATKEVVNMKIKCIKHQNKHHTETETVYSHCLPPWKLSMLSESVRGQHINYVLTFGREA